MRAERLPSRTEYLQRWSRSHGGLDLGRQPLVRTWLGAVYTLARPLAAARVPPDLLSLVGVLVAVLVVPVAAAGGRWPLLAALLVVVSGLTDSLDGAVAELTSRTTRWGYVLDSALDRVADAAYVGALYVLGAPGGPAVLAAALAWMQEYLRARAGAAGMTQVGVVTVSERPTRVIGAAMFLLGAGIFPSAAPLWATGGVALGVLAGLVALVQVAVAVRRWGVDRQR